MMADPLSLFYGLPLAALCGSHILLRRRSERLALARRNEAFEAGLTEPASLHPVIDPTRCIGCKACVNACPEGHILGLIGGKAQLIEGWRPVTEVPATDVWSLDSLTAARGALTAGFETGVPPFLPPVK
mgnify:CR=1 FL=1